MNYFENLSNFNVENKNTYPILSCMITSDVAALRKWDYQREYRRI